MKTKEMIEMLTCWSNDCHVWFDFDGHKANAAILLREAAHKLRKNAVEINNQKYEIAALKKELTERKAAPEWISMEERLPEKMGELCIVNRKSGDINLSVYFNHYWNYGDVTHWMPIPEPPKAKKKVKTYTDVYLERMKEAFPEAVLDGSVTGKCRDKLFGINKPCTYQCRDCWNQPYPEEEGGE